MTVDLSLLPPPEILETLSFEAVLAERKARLVSLYPVESQAEMAARLEIEGEPLTLLLEEMTYREILLRARVNEAARACMLATAQGSNLDNLAALYGVVRLIVSPGDAAASPPVLPTYETDARLRARAQLAVEGMSTAGPSASYRYHALSASGEVEDAAISSPEPGLVLATVLAVEGNGEASADLLDAVLARLSADDVRPLSDAVRVQSVSIIPYAVRAELTLYPGPAPAPILEAAQNAAKAYTESVRKIGYDITLSGLYAALHQPGVQNVLLLSPTADISIADTEAGYCTSIDITLVGANHV
jgi:phage-related baseplate assembly protein